MQKLKYLSVMIILILTFQTALLSQEQIPVMPLKAKSPTNHTQHRINIETVAETWVDDHFTP